MKYISINYDGRRWGIDAGDNIWTSPGDIYGWESIAGGLSKISSKGSHIVGTNSANDIYYAATNFDCGVVYADCDFRGTYALICDK